EQKRSLVVEVWDLALLGRDELTAEIRDVENHGRIHAEAHVAHLGLNFPGRLRVLGGELRDERERQREQRQIPSPLRGEGHDVAGDQELARTIPRLRAIAAACARSRAPNLERIAFTCALTVPSVMLSCAAIS